MASGNGNDPRLETLEQTLRNVPPQAAVGDISTYIEHTAQACDDLARYVADFARHLRSSREQFMINVAEMMGKIAGK